MTFPRDHLESPGQHIWMTSPADNLFNVRDCLSKYFFCFSLPFSIFFVTPLIRVGFSCFLATGRRVRVCLPNSNWAGEAPMPSVGVLPHSSMLRSGSVELSLTTICRSSLHSPLFHCFVGGEDSRLYG